MSASTQAPRRLPSASHVGAMEATRILLAAAEVHTRAIVKCSLERAGFQVAVVTDGKELLGYVTASQVRPDAVPPPHAIVVDGELRGLSGLEALRQLRRVDRGTPVVFVTSATEAVHEVLLARLRATAFVEDGPVPTGP